MATFTGTNKFDFVAGTEGDDTITGWSPKNPAGDLGPIRDNDALFGGGAMTRSRAAMATKG